jgi:hypothetical protein
METQMYETGNHPTEDRVTKPSSTARPILQHRLTEGYPGMLVTDPAPLRCRFYHKPEDTPDKIQYDFLTSVVDGLAGVIEGLAR